jgi:hypothetical protein
MKVYKSIISKKNKIKTKSRQYSKQQLSKNKSLTYFNYDKQMDYLSKLKKIEPKKNNDINNTLLGNNNNNNNYNINQDTKNSNCFFREYEYNSTLLLKAYKKSISELFKTLKAYMNKELYKYDKLKREFLNNIQKYYIDEKKKEKKINKNKILINNDVKSYSKKRCKESSRKRNKELNYSEIHKNNSGNLTSLNKYINNNNGYDKLIRTFKCPNSGKINYTKKNEYSINNKQNNNKAMNRANINISDTSIIQNQNNNNKKDNNKDYNKDYNKEENNKDKDKDNFNSFNDKHKSLFTLFKTNNNILVKNQIKNVYNCRNDKIIKKIIKYNKNNSENKKIINNTYIQSIIKNDKDDCKVSEKITKSNELISKIKESLDDNLKHIFNFSYENFLNKESEREYC